VSRLESNVLPMPGQFNPPRPRPTEIPQIPRAGDDLRDAIFGLEDGQVAVGADQPKSTFYVLALAKRLPVDYASLYAPSGPRMSLQMEVLEEARERKLEAWLNELRKKAGLSPDWAPPDEPEDRRSRPRDEE